MKATLTVLGSGTSMGVPTLTTVGPKSEGTSSSLWKTCMKRYWGLAEISINNLPITD